MRKKADEERRHAIQRIQHVRANRSGIKQLIAGAASISCLTALLRVTTTSMKVTVIFLGVLACALAAEKYTTKYDNIDVDAILRNERLLNSYVNCLLEAGGCTPDGKELKKSLPDALENDCSKCSEKQRAGSEKVIRFLVNQRPDLWEKLSKKYDPEGKYKVKFEGEARKHGIDI